MKLHDDRIESFADDDQANRTGWHLVYCFILSLLIHACLFQGARLLPPLAPPEAKTSQIEIEIKEPVEYKKDPLITREAFIPDEMKAPQSDDPLAFFSKENQRVKKQLRALRSGMTANRANRLQAPSHSEMNKTDTRKLFELADQQSPVKVQSGESQSQSKPSFVQLPQGLSTVGEALPEELDIGSFTALNTDRYLYYSFFARVEELIRYNWESGVRSAADRQPHGFFETSLTSSWATEVDILLRPNGEFHKAVLLKEAGIVGFDWAAMDAFAAAKIFPHPPLEMVESDGFIHLHYLFKVYTHPKVIGRQ